MPSPETFVVEMSLNDPGCAGESGLRLCMSIKSNGNNM